MNDPKPCCQPGEAQGSRRFYQALMSVSLFEVIEDTGCILMSAPDLFFQGVKNKTVQHVNMQEFLGCIY